MQGCPRLTSQRGVFTAQVGNTALQWTRDERGLELVSQGLSDLTFIGEDKLQELLLAGEYEEPDVVDEVPIDCWLTLAGPSPIVIDDLIIGKRRPLNVATSYPRTLDLLAKDRGISLRGVEVSGACEGEVAAGGAELIFDITASGESLRANGLRRLLTSDRLNLLVVRGITKIQQSPGLAVQLQEITSVYKKRLMNPTDSMTSALLSDQNKRVKKLGEEYAELLQALMDDKSTDQEVISEAADVLYAMNMFLTVRGISLLDVLNEDVKRNAKEV